VVVCNNYSFTGSLNYLPKEEQLANMARDDSNPILAYHETTKHSEISLRTSGHYLDWDNKPSAFKQYKNRPSTALSRQFPHPKEASLKTIKDNRSKPTKNPDLDTMAELLFFSAGLTRKMRFGSQPYYMRAAPATGALYPIEVYIINGDIPQLNAGVYHYNPLDFSLVHLREGDYRSQLSAKSHEAVSSSPVTFALTSLAWRNAWKYEARSYRHWFWDGGVIAANLLATCISEKIWVKLIMGFVDSEVNNLLGLEKHQEAPICMAAIGTGLGTNARSVRPEIPALHPDVEPLSRDQTDYPIMWEANKASELPSADSVKAWQQGYKPRISKLSHSNATFQLRPLKPEDSPSLEQTILRRGSTRRFAQQAITFESLSTIVDAAATCVPLDFLPEGETLTDFYLIANDVQGLPSGSYFFNPGTKSLEQLKTGRLRHMSGYLCLDQPLFSDASVVFFLMADLPHTLACLGPRGYCAAQFEAGVHAGKIYLSSYSVGVGASGSTFYDDAVTEFFSPHAKDKSPMIAVGVGVPSYKARPGRILPQLGQA